MIQDKKHGVEQGKRKLQVRRTVEVMPVSDNGIANLNGKSAKSPPINADEMGMAKKLQNLEWDIRKQPAPAHGRIGHAREYPQFEASGKTDHEVKEAVTAIIKSRILEKSNPTHS